MIVTQLCALTAGVALVGYLLGSVNTAILVSRFFAKEDIRDYGSGNAGMTNILRTYGKKAAALTAFGDFFKMAASILLARWVFAASGAELPLDIGYIAGFASLLGHIFPVFFRFRGGKGVMSALAFVFLIDPVVFLIIAAVFIPLVFITRIVSLGSVLGAISYPFITWAVHSRRGGVARGDIICTVILAAILLIMHRDNIKRLLSGTEHRFQGKKKS